MTGVVIAAVVIAAAMIGAAIARGFGRSPTAGVDRIDEQWIVEQWIVEARSLIDEGHRLSEQVAGVVDDGAIRAGPGPESADPSAGFDLLTSRLAELAATAPTVMDVRVCRSAAIRSRALSEVLRTHLGRDPMRPSNVRRAIPPVVNDRRHEFDVAMHDLADHVELL